MALTLLGRYTGQCSKYDAKLPILTCEMKQFSTRKRPPYWICVSRSIFTGASAERNIWYAGSYLEAFHYFSFFQVAGLSLPLPCLLLFRKMPFSSKNLFKTPREAQVMTSIHQGGEWGDGGWWWNSQTMWVNIANWRCEGIHHITFSAVCILLNNLLLVNKIKITQIKILFVKNLQGFKKVNWENHSSNENPVKINLHRILK